MLPGDEHELWRSQNVVLGNAHRPTVRDSESRVKGVMHIGEPMRPSVVQIRQRAFPERLGGVPIAGDGALRVARSRHVQPLDPLGRVKPAVAQLDEPAGRFRDGGGTANRSGSRRPERRVVRPAGMGTG